MNSNKIKKISKRMAFTTCWIILGVILFSVIVFLGCLKMVSDRNTDYTIVDAQVMIDELQVNPLRAAETYYNDPIEIVGYLDTIASDGKYVSIVPSIDTQSIDSIHCRITDYNQIEALMTKNIGDKVTIQGKVTKVHELTGYTIEIYSLK